MSDTTNTDRLAWEAARTPTIPTDRWDEYPEPEDDDQ